MNNIYHNLRKIKSPEFARMFIREILEKNKGNVSKTSKELNISRHTVRRARDGDLYDYSKAPKNPKKKHHNQIKEIIVFDNANKRTGIYFLYSAPYFIHFFKSHNWALKQFKLS